MTDKPFISVVIPLYNKEKSIARTIKGILAQTYHDFEIVIIDDGSTDRSVDVVKSISDERIKLFSQPNAGPSSARNAGVRKALADWIVFLDADDEITEDALEYYVYMIKRYPTLDILDCNKYNRTGDNMMPCNHPIEGWVKNNMRACYLGHISPGAGFSVFRKTLLEKCPYDERLRRFEDAELLPRLLKKSKVYSSRKITSIHDNNFAEASGRRKNIDEDAVGHITLKGKNFWEKMAAYRFFLEERMNYPEECHRLYPHLYYRYDLLLIHKLLGLLK